MGVIVTGGARGLGLCVAISLLEVGAPFLCCVDILPEPVADEWTRAKSAAEATGARLMYRQLDITNAQEVRTTFAEIYEASTVPIAGFFGAAGIQQMLPALDYPIEDFKRVMEVNVTGRLSSHQSTRSDYWHLHHDPGGGQGDGQTGHPREHRDYCFNVGLCCQQG